MCKRIRFAAFFFLSLLLLPADRFAIPEPEPADNATRPHASPATSIVDIGAELAGGYLLLGEQVKQGNASLTPRPDLYYNYIYGANINLYLGENFTLEFFHNRGLIRAASLSQGAGAISLYDYSASNFGLGYRFIVLRKKDAIGALQISAGGQYGTLDLDQEYKNALQKAAAAQRVTLTFNPNSASGFGFYTRGFFKYYFGGHMHFFAGIEILYQNVKYPNSPASLDGLSLVVPLGFGLNF